MLYEIKYHRELGKFTFTSVLIDDSSASYGEGDVLYLTPDDIKRIKSSAFTNPEALFDLGSSNENGNYSLKKIY